ncbi:hypothetical protein OMP43_22735 [Sphingomonas sp. CBMAI 2297]|uniref:energy transducer TonB n=1 Tax=Sphingomonas sp. CBMAI 2297 TaxID=2991720 RepID=UPI002458268F|nr:hypothetical protein [Sphingomonas sp. CBMAI 2297]MDH4746850.1 hypothetical protein [Sphingomonas sp. CBMAI 2297]
MILATLLALAGQTVPAVPAPIMTITVQKLPASYTKSPVVHLDFDKKGAVSACTVEQSSGSPGIDKVACQQVQTIKLPAEGGKAPESRSAPVEFVAGGATAQ